jgi:nucleoside-triphosphatase THEP1
MVARVGFSDMEGCPQMNLLLTGRPGVGKTTIIQRIISQLTCRLGGFTTQEIRRGDLRVGFSIRAVDDDQEGILAHIDSPSPYRVSKYGVNVDEMERVGVAALCRALESSDLIVMDEIGRMENYCPTFRRAVLDGLDASQMVLGTLQMRSTPFLDAIRQRPDVIVKLVTSQNRDGLPVKLLALLDKGVVRSGWGS